MSCYVDNPRNPYGRMQMAHLIADTHDELMAMALQLGLREMWLQHPYKYDEHFDVCLSYRAKALELGAIPLTSRQLVERLRAKRVTPAG